MSTTANNTSSGTSSSIPQNLPFHPSSDNYTTAANTQEQKVLSEKSSSQTADIPADGRKNSNAGETSPVLENWKPNLDRKQSWNQQDFKRENVKRVLERRESLGLDVAGVKTGFSEVAE